MAYVPDSLTAPKDKTASGGVARALLSRAVLAPIAAVIVFLAFCEVIVWANGWPNYIMASPSDLPAAYSKYWNLFLVMGWQTLWRTVAGLLIAIVAALLLGAGAVGLPLASELDLRSAAIVG